MGMGSDKEKKNLLKTLPKGKMIQKSWPGEVSWAPVTTDKYFLDLFILLMELQVPNTPWLEEEW